MKLLYLSEKDKKQEGETVGSINQFMLLCDGHSFDEPGRERIGRQFFFA